MSDRNFSRRRRGGMRFRPSGGLGHASQKPDRDATEARAEVVGGTGTPEKVYERRHAHEIERAENIAAGLPPEGAPPEPPPPAEQTEQASLPTPAPLPPDDDKPFKPVNIPEKPKGIVDSIRVVANNLVKKVQRLIKPQKKLHKEVIINAETLETRVAVSEDGKLEEFNIERTTEERLVGSIFKGKVRNLQDDLKAAFVDIGFEKNAFL